MIAIETKALKIAPIKVIWFAAAPGKWNFLNSFYKQSPSTQFVLGYLRKPFFTKTINLQQSPETIEAGFDRNTLYEIRRATKDGVEAFTDGHVDDFIEVYNEFAKTKNLETISRASLTRYKDNLVITYARHNSNNLVMHAYLVDRAIQRVRLLHSASLFRKEHDSQTKATIGRANRLLHLKDILHFQNQGFRIYDLGGYAPDTKDEALIRINQFKDSFGGMLLAETDYCPLLAAAGLFLKNLFKR
ncbi:hypothetical protein C8P68_104164 [Mucilaginibacter yixingensis]|uniref:Acetyltransferase (GNAT) family protein n=1 Tax=Mucilaginibacter yixingensis TaxID=1295612 RepID=A0A2T5J9C9_9SPHI|nr:hypothetical protein [Mucilaginibacter yixingensis]PTQ96678.1 hypothetical protein C8P68_104164 [Mucilaginibacter yixingensis]